MYGVIPGKVLCHPEQSALSSRAKCPVIPSVVEGSPRCTALPSAIPQEILRFAPLSQDDFRAIAMALKSVVFIRPESNTDILTNLAHIFYCQCQMSINGLNRQLKHRPRIAAK